MIYTKFFAGVLNENGPFQINADQWKRVMNIVYLEGSIQGLLKARNPKLPHQFDAVIFGYQKKLTDLTGNLQPSELIREMYQISRY